MTLDPSKFELSPHPFAQKFPPLTPEAFGELKESIRQCGLLEPLIINEQGQILDGNNRKRACDELGIEAAVVQLADVLGPKAKEVTEIEFIFNSNYYRRHLTDDQRAALCTIFLPQLREQHRKNSRPNIQLAQLARRNKAGPGSSADKLPRKNNRGSPMSTAPSWKNNPITLSRS
jgi:ParB-like chromosome segregation protein Spo0J